MRFQQIQLQDYRQFFGEQTLTFASGKEGNITLINGANGAGKTHLFEAMNWCLYGEYIQNRGAIVSKEKAVTVNFGEEIDCTVSIWYSHEGSDYVVVRRGRAKKIRLGSRTSQNEKDTEGLAKYKGFTLQMLPPKEDDFRVFRKTPAGAKELSDPSMTIDRALPQNARQYFLFDGEKMDELSKPEHDREVKEAVRNILQLPSIERAIEHLKNVRKDLVSKAKKLATTAGEEDLFRAMEDIQGAMDEAKKALQDRSEKIAQVRNLKMKIDEDLRKFARIKELTRRRDDLQKSYDLCQKRTWDLKDRLAELLGKSHLITCHKVIADAGRFLEERREKGQIPPGIREPFIKDLIEKGRCICGNDLSEGTAAKVEIEGFLKESRTRTRVAEEVLELMADLNQVKHSSTEVAKNLKKTLSDWLSSTDELDDIAGRLEDVHSQIKKVGDADITKLEKSRKECENDERNLIREQAEIELTMKDFVNYARDIEKELKRITKSKSASGDVARRAKLCNMAIEIFEAVYEDFARKKREEIEEQLKKIFYRLIWKKEQFPDVRLTEHYSLQMYDKYGAPAREELSAGERQVLSLAFITSMAFVTGGRIPLVMDTPFGRLFSEHRANIAREIPELTNQWILLVQDEEVSKDTLNILMPRVGAEYQLSFADGCTTIEEV